MKRPELHVTIVTLSALMLLGSPASAYVTLTAPTQRVRASTIIETVVAQRRGKRGKMRKRGPSSKHKRLAQLSKPRRTRRRGVRRSRAADRPAPQPAAATEATPIVTTRRAPARVDFDERLVQGQSNNSGAIYIFERQGAELKTMVRRRTSFRDEILRTLN